MYSQSGNDIYDIRTCVECGNQFFITEDDFEFYTSKNWDLPRRCQKCREVRRKEKENREYEKYTAEREAERVKELRKHEEKMVVARERARIMSEREIKRNKRRRGLLVFWIALLLIEFLVCFVFIKFEAITDAIIWSVAIFIATLVIGLVVIKA